MLGSTYVLKSPITDSYGSVCAIFIKNESEFEGGLERVGERERQTDRLTEIYRETKRQGDTDRLRQTKMKRRQRQTEIN